MDQINQEVEIILMDRRHGIIEKKGCSYRYMHFSSVLFSSERTHKMRG